MTFNDEFYEKYQAYLLEDNVRKMHDKIGYMLQAFDFNSALDIGCGLREFEIYMPCHNGPGKSYLGLDKNSCYADLICDYRNVDFKHIKLSWEQKFPGERLFTSFVSLFSIEPTADHMTNYKFYEKLFLEFPNIRFGLSSGFYYKNQLDKPIVYENGGLVSHQTLESIHEVESEIFMEIRIILSVPSDLFGQDVYEVWKVFERR